MPCQQTHISVIGSGREVELLGGRGVTHLVFTVYAESVWSLTFAEIHLRS